MDKHWIKKGIKSVKFEGFTVYLLRCWNSKEEFYKIGKSYTGVYQYLTNLDIPYKWEIVDTITKYSKDGGYDIINIEERLHTKNSINLYAPKILFKNNSGCYNMNFKIQLNLESSLTVTIPEWQAYYIFSSNIVPIYYVKGMKLPASYPERIKNGKLIWKKVGGKEQLWSVRSKKFMIKNSGSANKVKKWRLNGQSFHNLHWKEKSEITAYYHKYFAMHIIQQLEEFKHIEGNRYKISCIIYETKDKNIIDIDNLYLLEKFFIDAFHGECNLIPDDNPNYVIEAGKKSYVFVDSPEERKLIFKIDVHEG